MKKAIALVLALSMALVLCGCGLNEYQQRFIDAVSAAENSTEETSLEAIEDAFSKYLTLSEGDAKSKEVEEAKETLFELFNDKVNALSQEEMSAALDARISDLEAIVSGLPESLQGSISGCEQLKSIRSKHFLWYVDQEKLLSDNIMRINELFDGLYLSKTVEIIDETLPLLEELEGLSYELDLSSIRQQYGISSLSEIIELLENIKETIPQMCYTDCYVVRFEFLCDYPKDYIESGESTFWYGYSYRSTMMSKFNEYKEYLDSHFGLLAVTADDSYTYLLDTDTHEQLTIKIFEVQGWSVYAVLVTPPHMLDSEKNWEA